VALNELKQSISQLASYMAANYANLSSAVKTKAAEVLNALMNRAAQEEGDVPSDQPVPDTAKLLWELAGRGPSAFVKYMRQFPDPALEPYLKGQPLVSLIERLEQEMPKGEPQEAGGIPKAWLQSSNVYGFKYDPKSQRMFVRFHGEDRDAGPVYQYDSVPPEVAEIIRMGAVPAKTDGSNKYGSWWKNKQPSLGAAVNALLAKGPFPYKKLGG